MKKKTFKLASLAINSLKIASIVCLTLASTMVNAQTPITVVNGDFSLPVTNKQENWLNVPGWSTDTQATSSGIENGQRGFVWNVDPPVHNLTDHVIALNETYQLSLKTWDSYNADQLIAILYYDSGNGTRVVLGTKSVAVSDSSVTLTAAAVPASVGAKLGIEITCTAASAGGSNGWADFDDVTLTSTSGAKG